MGKKTSIIFMIAGLILLLVGDGALSKFLGGFMIGYNFINLIK